MSYVYNITFVTSPADSDRAVHYITTTLLPSLSAGGAASPRLCRVHSAEVDTHSYALEWRFPSTDTLEQWRKNHLSPALSSLTATWGERMLFFHTLLEQIDLPCQPPTTE